MIHDNVTLIYFILFAEFFIWND